MVPGVVDAGQPRDAQAAHPDAAGKSEEVDVGGHPATVVQLPEVVHCLVVAPDEDGEARRRRLLPRARPRGCPRRQTGVAAAKSTLRPGRVWGSNQATPMHICAGAATSCSGHNAVGPGVSTASCHSPLSKTSREEFRPLHPSAQKSSISCLEVFVSAALSPSGTPVQSQIE